MSVGAVSYDAAGRVNSEPPDPKDVQAVRAEVAALLGSYARAVGVIDVLLREHVDKVGTEIGPVLSAMTLDRVRDEDRFRLLRALLGDIGSAAPRDAIDGALRQAKKVRDEAAHSAEWVVVAHESGDLAAALFRPIGSTKPSPVEVSWRELVGHRLRLDWVTHWLQIVYLSDPAFATEDDRGSGLVREISSAGESAGRGEPDTTA